MNTCFHLRPITPHKRLFISQINGVRYQGLMYRKQNFHKITGFEPATLQSWVEQFTTYYTITSLK